MSTTFEGMSIDPGMDLDDCTDYDKDALEDIRESVNRILAQFSHKFTAMEVPASYQNYLIWHVTDGTFNEAAMTRIQKILPSSTWSTDAGRTHIQVPIDDHGYKSEPALAAAAPVRAVRRQLPKRGIYSFALFVLVACVCGWAYNQMV